MSLGEGLNEDADLELAVSEIMTTEETYVKKARAALCSLAEALGGVHQLFHHLIHQFQGNLKQINS